MANPSFESRALVAADLEAVVDIDKRLAGRSRRRFFEKRLEAVLAAPGDFVAVGIDAAGQLEGYAFARIHGGEFGMAGRTALLDVIGVAPDNRSRGAGRMLLEALDGRLRHKDVGELRTQTDWRFHDLMRFFHGAGFRAAPVHVLERPVSPQQSFDATADDAEPDPGSGEAGGDAEFPAPDHIALRSLRAEDLDAIVHIDRRVTGRDRRPYFEAKIGEILDGTGIRVSPVAEIDGNIVGVVMARVDYGEFGRAEPAAVIHTVNVDPGFRQRGVGHALMALLLGRLGVLRVEAVRTTVPWNDFALLAFFEGFGFAPGQRLALARAVPS
jgi:ribosomal protein S18 acetylase RimI-like enzyme